MLKLFVGVRSAFVVFPVLVICALCPANAEARKWTTRDGKHTVEAELVKVEGGKVVLKRDDGKEVRVELTQLSPDDVKHVLASLGKPRDPKPQQTSPNPNGDSAGPDTAKVDSAKIEGTAASEVPDPKATVNAQEASVKPGPGAPPLTRSTGPPWQVVVDPPAEQFELPKNHQLKIPIATQVGIPHLLFPSASSPFVATGDTVGRGVFRLFDVRSSAEVGVMGDAFPKLSEYVLSPDGRYMAVATSEQIQLWSFKTGKVDWALELKGAIGHMTFLDFAGPDRVLTAFLLEHSMSVWDVPSGKKLGMIPFQPGTSTYAVSPGGAYLAECNAFSSKIQFFDTRNGVLAGELSAENIDKRARPDRVCWSHDGKLVVAVFSSFVTKFVVWWSVDNAKQIVQHALKLQGAGPPVREIEWFADNSAWRLNREMVVDRLRGGPIQTEVAGKLGPPRRYVDATRMLEVVGKRDAFRLDLVPIPKDPKDPKE